MSHSQQLSSPTTRALTLAAWLALGGCGGDGGDPGAVGGPSLPSWLAELPQREVAAAPGAVVWAVVPEAGSESAALASYRVEAAASGTAVLVDALGNRFADVPGALIHPASRFSADEIAAGHVVLADRWDAEKVVGRVASREEGEIRVAYDWNGSTASGVMDAVLPLPGAGDSLALRWVAYRPEVDAAWYKGLCFGESDERLWIADDSGHVAIAERDAVRVLDDLGRDLQPGDAVSAYSWGYGYRSGRITAVLEPGLRYAVELQDGETRAFFFDSLTQAL